jgi:hypothetical protein
MEITGEYTFDAPQNFVWEALHNPQVLGSVMPGGQGFDEVGEYEYEGSLKIKVGPVQGVFKAEIKLSDVVAPESYRISVDGKGGPGFVSATGNMKLEGRGAQTYMEYAGEAHIGGRIASVGQRLIDSTAHSIITHSLEGLNEYLKVQVAQQQAYNPDEGESNVNAQESAAAVPTYKPPSETEMAMKVARDVINDIIPPSLQPALILGGLVIIAVIVWLLLNQ